MRDVNEIVVHCSATHDGWWASKPLKAKINEIKKWHLERGFNDVGYHYLIDVDGTIGKGRPVELVPASVKGHNTGTIAICLIGGATSSANDKFEDNFSPAQDAALRRLIEDIRVQYPTITKVSGHNQYANKACPGFNADAWYKEKKPRGLSQSSTVRASLLGGGSTVVAGASAVGSLDGNAQLMFIALTFVTVLAFAWIFRERIKKWAAGIQ